MRLLRLALLTLNAAESASSPPQDFPISFPDLKITVGPLSATVLAQTFLLPCAVQLQRRPKMTSAGVVRVPQVERQRAEEAIEHYANLMSVSFQAGRTISSPSPCVALFPEDETDRAYLARALGFLAENTGFDLLSDVELDPRLHLQHFADRFDGLALMAEALGNFRSSAQFREFIRLFERAFRIGGRQLVDPLAKFLGTTPQGFTRSEVDVWIDVRDGVTHADKRNDILFEGDVARYAPRLHQAANDVLLNKLNWRTPDADRRTAWRPDYGLAGPTSSSGVFGVPGAEWRIPFRILDEFARFPKNLSGNLTAPLQSCWTGPFLTAGGDRPNSALR